MGKVLPLPGDNQAARGSALDGHTDEELMALVRADSRAAFRVLVTRHAETVAAFCGRVARDRSAAREVSQAVWLALWDARARWEPRASFRSYLFAIAFSRARNHARGRHRAGAVFAPSPLPVVLPDRAPSDVERLIAREQTERMWAALESLPADMRQAVVLRFGHELPYEEMEKIQGTKASTLRSRVHHALLRLRAALEEAP
jgi:RNA polymerase sigma-70 factor (ECF subfamily)